MIALPEWLEMPWTPKNGQTPTETPPAPLEVALTAEIVTMKCGCTYSRNNNGSRVWSSIITCQKHTREFVAESVASGQLVNSSQ